MDTITSVVIVVGAVTTAATGGVYLAFSAMVMPALSGTREAVDAMKRINVRAPRSAFLLPFLASAIACAAAVFLVLARLPAAHAALALAGALAGLAAFVVTAAVNVPLNNRLDADALPYPVFERRWRRANAWRGILSLAGSTALTAALVV